MDSNICNENIKPSSLLYYSSSKQFKIYFYFFRSAPDAAPPAAAPGAPGAPGADGAPAGPPAGPPNTSSNRRLQQTQAQVEEVSFTFVDHDKAMFFLIQEHQTNQSSLLNTVPNMS